MKATVATGNQTYTVEVSGEAKSIFSREREEREASGAKGGVSRYRLLSKALFRNVSLLCCQEAHHGETQQVEWQGH